MTSASIESPVATRDEWSPIGRSHIVDTATFVFWIALAATLYSGLQLFNKIQEIPTLQVQPANGWLALVLWSAYTAVFFAVLIRVQLFVRRSPWVIVGAFLWGGVTATYFAAQANAAFEDTLKVWLGPTADDRWITAVSAATNEETLKTLGIVVLVLLPLVRVRSTLDGWFYGTIIGLGFQVVEDFVYTIQESGNLTDVSVFLVQRGFFAGLWAHAIYSGIAGAGIGYLATRRDRSLGARIGVGVGLFVVAWLLHFVWDAPLLEDSLGNSRAAFFATILIKGVPALAILLWVVHVARKAERVRWSAFVQEHVDPTIVPPADAKALLDHRSRRAARVAAGRGGGARAKRVCAEIQTAELRYVQAVSEEGAESTSARRWADRIAALRREPVSSGTA